MFWFRPKISEGSNWPLFYLWSEKASSFISVHFTREKASFYFGESEPSLTLESGDEPWSNDWFNLKCTITHGDQSKIDCSILNHKTGASVSGSVELPEIKWPNGDLQGFFEVNSESVQIKDFRYFNQPDLMNEYERPHSENAVFLTSFIEEYSFLTPEAPVDG